ncbi:MAG: adenylate/guanylate cyclase domain-containing protein [Anaerolineae bacterium]
MESLAAYIPMDRRRAMATGDPLPDRAQGAALFADISGYTPLTEALVAAFGPRLGVDRLTQNINEVWEALIAEVHRHGGSVIVFIGDAITCWFEGDDGLRATACALAMQRAMARFARIPVSPEVTISLSIKAAIAAGPARRFARRRRLDGYRLRSLDDGREIHIGLELGWSAAPRRVLSAAAVLLACMTG